MFDVRSWIMSWLCWLVNAVAPVLVGIAIIYIVGKIWSRWFSTHDGRRDRE